MSNTLTDAQGKIAAFHAKEAAARQVAQEAEAERRAEEARLQAETQAQAEQSALEARRAERLQAEVLDGITEEERAALRQQANELPQRLAQQARQQAEDQFAAQLQQEREQMIITRRNEAIAHGPYSPTIGRRIMAEVDQIINEKAQTFLAERERRELQAEKHDDPHYRLIHSLDDNARAIFSQLLDQEPKIGERVKSIRQEKTAVNVATLTEQYKTAMLSARGKPSELRRIKEQYRAAGASVDSVDFS